METHAEKAARHTLPKPVVTEHAYDLGSSFQVKNVLSAERVRVFVTYL